MAENHGLCLSQKHRMILLIDFLQGIFTVFRKHQGADHRTNQSQHVLFVDGQPVLYTVTKILEHNLCKIHKPVNGFTVAPGTSFIQSCRHINMEHGNQGFDTIFQTFIDHIVVVLNTKGVNGSGTFGENT